MRSDVSNQVEASTPHILSQDKLKLFWITWPWDNDSGSAWGQITCGEGAPGDSDRYPRRNVVARREGCAPGAADEESSGYGGVAHTHPATVRIKRKDGEVTIRDFDWIGRPFTAPVYYGVRVWRWNSAGRSK